MLYNFDKSHLRDNDSLYFDLLESVIKSVDRFAIIKIDKSIQSFNVRVSINIQNGVNSLISQINSFNNAMGIKVEFGKSFKKNTNIFFKIPIFA
jgi:hypothetical protein